MRTNHLLLALCLINILAQSTLAMEHATHSDMASCERIARKCDQIKGE